MALGDSPPKDPGVRRRLLREVLLAAGGATLACSILSLLQGYVPLVRSNLYLLVAAIFLYLPVLLLKRRGLTTQDVGLTTTPLRPGLTWAALTVLVIFPPYALGFHLWQGWMFGNEPKFQRDAYLRWPVQWEGSPGAHESRPGLELFTELSRLEFRWRGLGRLSVTLHTDGEVEVLRRRNARHMSVAKGMLSFEASRPGAVVLRVKGGSTLTVAPRVDGRPLEPERIRLGAGGVHPDDSPIQAHRTPWWIFLMILSHLLLVALPEELFYRGYVQTTLEQVWPGGPVILGARLGTAIVVTSVLFALGHYLVDFNVQRLAVFFPSLLFGWLRAKTGNLVAPILVHAASNVFSDLLTKGYVT